ncbi:Mic14p [Saccharomyces cerevisiae YJM1401]|nr:Mic14p [Saccharomyces cerevisiae YJM1401]
MSDILDEIVIEDVVANCPQEFLQYHKCIRDNEENPGKCKDGRMTLSTCIREKVPSVKSIMSECSKPMKKYDQCIRDNMGTRTINENCLGFLQDLRKCAELQVKNKNIKPSINGVNLELIKD